MYNDLIRELSVLESSKKKEQAIDFLSSRRGLKGKQNPDLQLSASAVVFKGKKMFYRTSLSKRTFASCWAC